MREVHSGKSLPEEIRKHSHKQYKCMFLKKIRKEQAKLKVSIRKEIIQIKAEINGIETKKQQKRSMKVRVDSFKR